MTRLRSFSQLRTLLAGGVVLAVLLVTPSSALAIKTIGLSAGSFKFVGVNPGQSAAGSVEVSNDGTEPIKVLVYAADQSIDPQGTVSYTAPNREDLMALAQPSTWTKITMPANSKSLGNIPYLEMKPGAKIPIRFMVTVPQGIAPGDHNLMIFFEVFDTKRGTAQISGRLGTRITLRVNGTIVEKLEVRPFNVPAYVIGKSVPWDFTLRNSGNVDERMSARTVLLDRGGNEVMSAQPVNARLVFAKNNLEATGTFAPQGAIGPYTVRVEAQQVDDNGQPIAGKVPMVEQHATWILPLWLIVVVVGVALLLIVVVVSLIASRAGARAQRKRSARAPRTSPYHAPSPQQPQDDSYYVPGEDE